MDYLLMLFLQTSTQLDLPPGLLQSICFVETRHDVAAIHYSDGDSNSVGICQIKLKTAKWLGFKGTEKQLMEPKNNIYYAGKYLQYQLRRYKVIHKAVIAYNFGHAGKYVTTAYQAKVYQVWEQHEQALHETQHPYGGNSLSGMRTTTGFNNAYNDRIVNRGPAGQ